MQIAGMIFQTRSSAG
ncbi:MAG: DUF6783 domain-containing protein [Ruminococcus sp.]|nr:DUF6783 domain-containing protein [Ruminococcus sp.]